jgi:hypothetical protein
MNRLVLFMIVPLLAGCNVHSKNPANDDENVSITADDSGHVSFNLPIAEGNLKIPSLMMHHGNIDIDGVKLMPGSSVTGFKLDAQHDKGATVEMSFTSPAPPDQVRSYFVEQFRKQDVQAGLSGDSVVGKSRDGNPFTITVAPAPNGSQGKIVAVSND